MKIKVKKLLKETNEYDEDSDIHGYQDIEEIRISIGEFIDRNVLTPKGLMDLDKEEADASFVSDKDYLNRIKDVVKQGRKIPFLYYAYKGVDEKGNLLNQDDILPVLKLQQQKAGQLIRSLEFDGGDATMLMFMCDFGLILSLHDEWDKRYEQRMKELLPKRTYDRMAMKMGYDRAEFQAGRSTSVRPFSTVALGKGSKPLYAQSVDFMYKTSPEPNKNVQDSHLWAFSIRLPLTLTYMSLAGMNPPPRPKYDSQGKRIRVNYKKLAQERLNSMSPQLFVDAYNHWFANEREYRTRYAERMRQEGANWFQQLPRLTSKGFNQNYVLSRTTMDYDKEMKFDDPHRIPYTTELKFITILQQPSISLEGRETLLDYLDDPEEAAKIKTAVLNSIQKNPNTPEVNQIGKNLQHLVTTHYNDPAIQDNLEWLGKAIQAHYIKGPVKERPSKVISHLAAATEAMMKINQKLELGEEVDDSLYKVLKYTYNNASSEDKEKIKKNTDLLKARWGNNVKLPF